MTRSGWLVACSSLVATLACVPDGRGAGGDDPPSAGGGPGVAVGPTPPLGPPVSATVAPPPISGGTLLILGDGKTAVAADNERDAVFVVDLGAERLLGKVALTPGDEPGRLVEDGAGRVLVVLRRGGGLAVVDPVKLELVQRVPVCPAARGIAVDAKSAQAFVACAGGELVALDLATLVELRRVRLDRDLRDVVVSGNQLYVSRFRAAEALVLSAADLSVVERVKAPGSVIANRPLIETMTMTNPDGSRSASGGPSPTGLRAAEPGVAWRMRPLSGGGAVMLHQESSNAELGIEEGGYGGGRCSSTMTAAIVELREGASAGAFPSTQIRSTLPIDFDVSRDGKHVALISLGGSFGGTPEIGYMERAALFSDSSNCPMLPPRPDEPIEYRPPVGDPVAIAFDGKDRLVVQTREPARVEILTHRGGSITLSEELRTDSGHKVFHTATGIGLACASCHPEGGDDGRVWRFAKLGARRTQNLLGGIAMTAPFHWDGQMRDLGQLMNEVFTARMRGPKLEAAHVNALGRWLDRLPAVAVSPAADPDAVTRGQTLFNDSKVACGSCHKAGLFTDNTMRMVGTGAMLQVPSLRGLGQRAPYMHDGCARTLMDRFGGTCGGGDQHGVTSHLTPAQLLDLVAYLETL